MSGETEHKDELIEALLFLTRYYGVPNSASALVTGLPLPDGKLTPSLFTRAAELGGLSAEMSTVPLNELSPLLLPAVILLKEQQAVVLLDIDLTKDRARVVLGCSDGKESVCSWSELQQRYSGQLFLVKKPFRFDERSPKVLKTRDGHWFWSTLIESRAIYRDVLLASLLINLFAIASPLFTMNVYDKIVPNLAFESLWVLAVGAVIVFTFDFVIRQLRSYFIDIAGKKSDMLLSAKIFSKVMGLRMEARPASTGAFAKHLQEFESIREFFTSSTIAMLVDLPFALLFLVVIWIFAGNLVIVPIVAIILLSIYSLLIQGRLKKSIEEGSRLASQKHANLIESIAGLETVKIFGAESMFQYRWEQAVAHISTWGIETRKVTNAIGALANYVQQMVTTAIIIMGVYQIANGDLSMGGLIAAVMLASRAIAPMIQLSVLSTRYNQASSALKILEQVMSAPQENEVGKQYVHHPKLHGEIEFESVRFAYPNTEKSTLQQINVHIRPGEKVAIIGRIGAGKSTLEKLILGLYQPSDGAVRLDGYDIGQLAPAIVRRNIGCAPQDIILFYGSIRDNIRLGNPMADEAAILRAAQRAGVTHFANQDPNGLDRQIGEGGRLLSGGQRQAIVLARALLNDPPILLLDEPTSNMDNRSEQEVKQELARLDTNTTLVLITHKSAMLDVVNRIIVMEQGQIVADGPKTQVLQMLKEGKIRLQGVQNG